MVILRLMAILTHSHLRSGIDWRKERHLDSQMMKVIDWVKDLETVTH